jgi:hypothetical protein
MAFNKPQMTVVTGRIPKPGGETFEATPEATTVPVSALPASGLDSVVLR